MQGERTVYGFLIRPDCTSELIYTDDFLTAIGCRISLVPGGPRCRFVAYCDEEGAMREGPGCGMNDLGAYMLEALGFRLGVFGMFGVRNNILIVSPVDQGPLDPRDAKRLEELAGLIRTEGGSVGRVFEDLLKEKKGRDKRSAQAS